jgi:hypothetical protein
VQHLQKALEQMNLKLTEVLSDITGVTGRAILRAILRGTRAPEKLAKYRDKGCKASEAEIAQALTGSYREEHLFALKLAYQAWQFTLGQVEQVDGQIALQLGRIKCDRALPPLLPKARTKRRVNSPRFDGRTALYYVVGLDLTEIEGISELTALTVISEIGPGVSRFATVKKFCSWLGLCPNWQKTGGLVKSSRTRRGVNRAAQALRMAAQSLHHSRGALGGFLRRMKGRRVPAADERPAGGAGGRDRDGAQAGPHRLPGAEARDDVRASESGGVRGPDEGEAGQGVAAEGTSAGAGRRRDNVGERAAGSRRVGAGVKKRKRESDGGPEGDVRREPVRQVSGPGRTRCAPRRTRDKDPLGTLNNPAGRRFLATDACRR